MAEVTHDKALWVQIGIASVVALAGGFGWVSWVGARVGDVDARLVHVERFANAHDDKWTAEVHRVDSRVAGLERECGRVQAEFPTQLHVLERRVDRIEAMTEAMPP